MKLIARPGTWLIYADSESPARCILAMPSTGTAISTQSSCYMPTDVVKSKVLRGSLTLHPNCQVTGTIPRGTDPSESFDAWISKGKDSLSGMVWRPGVINDGVSFSGVKL